ncbi:MAG TPA: hypothetical protein VFZ78_03790, partial [Flavisolibacter sp.]
VTDDYSMGYGSINGFRASIASSFSWYDLRHDAPTGLRIHPFCFMDANAWYEQKQDPSQALEALLRYAAAIREVNGEMITIWHNSFLGNHGEFAGWQDVYERFIAAVAT